MAEGIDFIGLLGGITIAVSLVPQVVKTWETKSASDISYFYQAVYIVGCTLTNAYAIIEGLWPVFIPCLFEELLIITLTIMKVIYDGRERQEQARKTKKEDSSSTTEIELKRQESTMDIDEENHGSDRSAAAKAQNEVIPDDKLTP